MLMGLVLMTLSLLEFARACMVVRKQTHKAIAEHKLKKIKIVLDTVVL